MANRRKEIPSYVSIEVGKVRGIAESMEDIAWAKWSKKALDDLSMGCVRKDVDPMVKELYDRTKDSMDREYLRKKEWYENNKKNSPQDAPNGNAGVDVPDAGNGAASKSPTSCDTFTADGDIREDSQAKPDGSAITRNETRAHDALGPSANQFTADASTREGEDERDHRGNTGTLESSTSANIYGDAATREGADESTTVSRNMRRVPQNEAPAHGFSGGRTAQGTMSRSPEAAAQSGKAYDQESAKTRDTRDNSRGRYAPPSCSPEDGNPAETAPSHGGSVASLEARQSLALESRRTGGSSVRGMAKVAQPSVRSFGESGLVHMTDAQANSLRSYYGEDFDRAVGILENYILSLPSKAEGDEKGDSKYWREDYAKRNHYFTMRRDNWVDNALKKSKTVDIRLEKAKQNPKSFKQMDADDRTEFFSKSIFDKEAI